MKTSTVYVDGVPKHNGKDVHALMALAERLYATRLNDITLCCTDASNGASHSVWMRYDRRLAEWKEIT